MNRREFVRTAGGATAGGAAFGATGGATAQSGGNATNETGNGTSGGGNAGTPLPEAPQPKYGSWFNNVGNYGGETADRRGQSTVTVTVGAEGNGGAFAFGPPAVHVSPGTTVQFEWTGEGGGHNVVSDGDGPLDSGSAVASAGVNYEYTFEEDGIYKYVCVPHEGSGMKGAVVVGTEYPAVEQKEGVETLHPEEAGVPIRPHYVGIATALAIVMALIFTFFVVKYGVSPHASGGNN